MNSKVWGYGGDKSTWGANPNSSNELMDIVVRDYLSSAYYDNYEAREVQRKLRQDNHYRQDVERLIRQGDAFETAIDKMEGRY